MLEAIYAQTEPAHLLRGNDRISVVAYWLGAQPLWYIERVPYRQPKQARRGHDGRMRKR